MLDSPQLITMKKNSKVGTFRKSNTIHQRDLLRLDTLPAAKPR